MIQSDEPSISSERFPPPDKSLQPTRAAPARMNPRRAALQCAPCTTRHHREYHPSSPLRRVSARGGRSSASRLCVVSSTRQDIRHGSAGPRAHSCLRHRGSTRGRSCPRTRLSGEAALGRQGCGSACGSPEGKAVSCQITHSQGLGMQGTKESRRTGSGTSRADEVMSTAYCHLSDAPIERTCTGRPRHASRLKRRAS